MTAFLGQRRGWMGARVLTFTSLLLSGGCHDVGVTPPAVRPLVAVPTGATALLGRTVPARAAMLTSISHRLPTGLTMAKGIRADLIPGLPDLVEGCGQIPMGTAFDGTYYYIAEGGWTNMCVSQYSASGQLLSSKVFPPDFRGLTWVPALNKLVGRTYGGWGGQFWLIDYPAGTASLLTSYDVDPTDPQSEPAVELDGQSYWLSTGTSVEHRRMSDGSLIASFPTPPKNDLSNAYNDWAVGVSQYNIYVPDDIQVDLYTKAGAFVQSLPLTSSSLACYGYGFGVTADGQRIGYDVDDNCTMVRWEHFTVVTTLAVGIEIKGTADTVPLNLKSGGKIPVAILSSATFDATKVDPASVTLGTDAGGAGVVKQHAGYMTSVEDVNGDGVPDLVLHFDTQALVSGGYLTSSTTSLVLLGKAGTGSPIRGTAPVRIVP